MSQHKDHFTPRMFHRLLAPSLAYSLGLAFAAMADAIVIGWQMGVTGLAALCFSLPLHTMLLAFVHGLGLGGSTRYARLLAEGKPAQATDCFNRVLQAGLAASVLLAALEGGDFELHIRDNTDFFDSFSAQADRLGGKGTLDMEAVGMQVIRQQAKEFSYQQYESFSTLVVRI